MDSSAPIQHWRVPSFQERLQAPFFDCPVEGCGVKYNCGSNTDKIKKHIQVCHPNINILHRKRKTAPTKEDLKQDRKRRCSCCRVYSCLVHETHSPHGHHASYTHTRYQTNASTISAKGYETRWLPKCIEFLTAEQSELYEEHKESVAVYDRLQHTDAHLQPPRPLFTYVSLQTITLVFNS
jgi:hypothetical protein